MLGAILMSASGRPILQIPVGSVSDVFLGGAQATMGFHPNGEITTTTFTDGNKYVGDWIVPKGAAPGPYSIRLTLISGSLDTGTVDTDLPLTSSRSFGLFQQEAGGKTARVLVELKLGNVALVSREIDFSAIGT